MTGKDETNLERPGEVLLFDKPYGWTSFQLVKKVRWITKEKKVGHAGTLDPLASGLLILCTGKKTKQIAAIQSDIKTYEAELTFGGTTASYDLETEVNHTFPWEHITQEAMEKVIKEQFLGEVMQTPPLFSAIKVDGKRAYQLARKGDTRELEPRKIFIESIEVLSFALPVVKLKVVCGKGTYIRTLANDLGKALESGAYLSGLRRTAIGNYLISEAWNIGAFEEARKRIEV